MTNLFRRSALRDEEGYAMLSVLLAFLLVSGLVLASMGYALSTVTQSRRGQDYRAAFAAAQAGVQDYVSRLNTCDSYWQAPCADSGTNSALTGWATVPGTSGTNTAQYSQRVLSNPLSTLTPGVVRLEVTGRVNGVSRTVVADLGKNAFLKFLYYSDYETFSPSSTAALSIFSERTYTPSSNTSFGSITRFTATRNVAYTLLRPTEDQVRRGCEMYYYDGRATFPRTLQWVTNGVTRTGEVWFSATDSPPGTLGGPNNASDTYYFDCLTINFAGVDTINGPLHSNDALSLSGNVTFRGTTTTSWADSGQAVNPPNVNKRWRNTSYTPQINTPQYHERIEMPPTNLNIRRLADATLGGTGCLYTGPTTIEFLANGNLKVKSPYTRSSNAGCIGSNPAVATEVTGPGNGVVYVQDVPSSTTDPNYRADCGAAQPVSEYTNGTGDSYDCMRGDAFVKGQVNGRFTVATAHDLIVVGNVIYQGGLTGSSVLGLVAQNNVAVYHPATESTKLTNVRIDAAIASVSNSFTVQNYSSGSTNLGSLTVNGVIVQRFRGPVGTSGGTGYDKNYNYDSRLQVLPPPSFLELQHDAWSNIGFSEEDPDT